MKHFKVIIASLLLSFSAHASYVVPPLSVTTGKLAASAVTTAKIADGAVTPAKKAALGQQVSVSSGSFITTSSSYVDVTNMTVTITTTGRPVYIGLISDGDPTLSLMRCTKTNANSASCDIAVKRGSTVVGSWEEGVGCSNAASVGTACQIDIPPGSFNFIDVVAAGTYTYKFQALANSSASAVFARVKMIAFEL